MATSPFNPVGDARIQSDAGASDSQSFIVHYQESPALGAVASVLAAVTDTGVEQTISTGFTQPSPARVISATAGGTAGDIGAIQVTINGTDASGAVITEDLPAFTVDTPGTVTGSKAFATVTLVVIPAHDGTGATTSIGDGAALGLAFELPLNTVFPGISVFNGTREGTDPTVTVSSTVLSSNTITFNSALDGSQVDAWYLVDGDE